MSFSVGSQTFCKFDLFPKVENGDAPSTKVGGVGKQKSIVEIYTDWANHYLEKTRGKHKIRCLQTELVDGLLLAEVIEAVTHQKVPDIAKKPKNRAAMVTNIQACLNFLLAKGVGVTFGSLLPAPCPSQRKVRPASGKPRAQAPCE